MSAAVSNAPASAASAASTTMATDDVEAPALDPTRDQLRPGGHPTTSGDAAAVELATGLDAGDAAGPAGGAQLYTTPRALEGSSLPFLAGLAGIISTIFILGDLLNKRMLHPASIVVFLLSVSYCVAMLRRQWASTGGGTREGRNNSFTKEARKELITYFVFGAGPEGLPTEAGAGAGAGKKGNRPKQQERGNGASGDELQVSRTSSRRWRRERQRSSGGDDDDIVGGAGVSDGGAARNGRIDANNADTGGSLSANTPMPSTGPCSPAPLEEEVLDGDAATAATAEDAAVTASPGHATAAVTAAATPTGPELPRATGEDAAEEQASAAAKAAAEDDPTRAQSDSGEWSTGQACIVCFGDYEPGDRLALLPCRHVYHAQCIDEWLDRAKIPSCPLCKTDLRHATPPDDRSRSISTAGGGGTSVNAARVGGGSGGGGGGERVEFTGDNAV
ncbi:conserved unknown protein [Ectocarpus siliculosus]|uniref:RING-type domain-containing protein n=1 Tax=Ectocarpus siliculosus TaxID=2880 RepID=D7FRQ1_ECTSI|nr:conserved unknown protein [Ectocarpus siliculosus]|eukprot:CBJ30842.1 conserved unknown protein [Ectocarpus siliculosus]